MTEEVTPVIALPTPNLRAIVEESYLREYRRLVVLYYKDSMSNRIKDNFPISIFRQEVEKLNQVTKYILETL
jgi:hypothetical protein